MVVKRRRGAALLREPEHVLGIVKQITEETGLLVSLKVRLGVTSPDELPLFLEKIGDAPVSEIIIHPRTAAQMYAGTPQLERLPECIAATRLRLGYSGDIRTPKDFQHVRTLFPKLQHIMLGRGLIANPLLALQLRKKTNESPAAVIRTMHDRLFDDYSKQLFGIKPLLGRMKELWFYSAQGFVHPETMLKRILRSHDLDEYSRAVSDFFVAATWCGLSDGVSVSNGQ